MSEKLLLILHPSPVRKRALGAYHSNPSPIKRHAVDSYHSDPSPIKQWVLDAYHSNPSPVKRRTLDAYYREHELNKAKQRKRYKDKKDKILDKLRIAALVSCSISKKYSRLCTGPSRLTVYIKNIVAGMIGKSVIEKHLFAEHLVKSCFQYRESYKNDFV